MTHKGFTLVEILIVVVILGILAAIVVPQFTEASKEAREAALGSDLQTVRSQLELYRIQHLGNYPTDVTIGLTTKTDADGTAGTAYGPYLTRFTTNPFNDSAAVKTTGVPGTGVQGWHYLKATGAFAPNDADHKTW